MTDGPTSFGEDVPAAPSPVAGTSMLDSLLADLTVAQDKFETSEFEVPGKPAVTVRYATDIPYEMLTAWQAAAAKTDIPDLRSGMSLLAWACRGLLYDGELVTDAGETVTFLTPSLHSRLGVTTATDAVRVFYGKDGYVLATYLAVLRIAGYSEQVSPTTR